VVITRENCDAAFLARRIGSVPGYAVLVEIDAATRNSLVTPEVLFLIDLFRLKDSKKKRMPVPSHPVGIGRHSQIDTPNAWL